MFTRAPSDVSSLFPFAASYLASTVGHHAKKDPSASPVQGILQSKWEWYAGAQYDACKYDWLGAPLGSSGALTKALVPQTTGIPPGFRTMAPSTPRLADRRPCAPGRHVKRVVDRFTAQLFGDGAHPILKAIGDEDTHHWLDSFARTSRLWVRWQLARMVGGAEGAVAVGFKVLEGAPVVEVYDPRFWRPVWANKDLCVLKALDGRWQVPASVRVDKGRRETWYYWVRRLLSDEGDLRYLPVWVERHEARELDDGTRVMANDGEEPRWERLLDEERSVRHDLGFCPAVWVPNLPLPDSEYGASDCDGLYEQALDLDRIRAGISTSVIGNADPTLVLSTKDGVFPKDLRKGTGNGIGLTEGGTASYLEISGGGLNVAIQWYEKCRDAFFAEAECYDQVSSQGAPEKTAFEVGANLGPQQSKLTILREQYGQQGVRRYLEMVLRVARALEARGEEVVLEPRIVREDEGEGEEVEPVRLGPGGYLSLDWPPLAQPSTTETSAAATAASAALTGKILDQQAAVAYAAPYFKVDDVAALQKRLREQGEEEKRQLEAQMQAGAGGGGPGAPAPGG